MSNHWFGEELMNIFSERLKGILDSRGISQVWVAEKANATAATISRYMTTDRVPRGGHCCEYIKGAECISRLICSA